MADDQDPSCSPDSGSVNNNGDAQQVAPPTMDVIGGAFRAAPAARDQRRAGPPAPPRESAPRARPLPRRPRARARAAAPPADPNLGLTMLVLLLMGLMNYSMRDPCTC